MVEDMETSRAQNIREYFPRDMAFHDRIAQMLDNSKLLEIYRRIVNEIPVRLQSIQRRRPVGVQSEQSSHCRCSGKPGTRKRRHTRWVYMWSGRSSAWAPLLPTQSAANQESKTSTEATSQFALTTPGSRNGRPIHYLDCSPSAWSKP